jgi:hypothetical protein
MSDDPIPFTAPQGVYLGTVTLRRMLDGTITASLDAMPGYAIKGAGNTPALRLQTVADWLVLGAHFMRDEAQKLRE